MRRFSELYETLDASTSTTDKLRALQCYFEAVPAADAAWAAYFLAGGRPRRLVSTQILREQVCRAAGIEDWLFEACYQAVGDLAETLSLLWPEGVAQGAGVPGTSGMPLMGLAAWVTQRLLPLRELSPDEQAERIAHDWAEVTPRERFIMAKLIGGGFRVGVSKLLVQRALAAVGGLDPAVVAQRMMGYTQTSKQPLAQDFARLVAPLCAGAEGLQPYPFCLANSLGFERHGLDLSPRLGPPDDWLVEWKYDGIRAQVLVQDTGVSIWSRGEELITETFPDVVEQARSWPLGLVLDGELLVWRDGRLGSFQELQKRLNRKRVGPRVLASDPVRFLAYDLLAWEGSDQRHRPLRERRAQLEGLSSQHGLLISPTVQPDHEAPGTDPWAPWVALRETARERGVEGFMLKPWHSHYGVGRQKVEGAGWWKWKLDPYTVDAILIYAQAGHGRRASVYTDYTFAVWSRPPSSPEEAQAVIDSIVARRAPEPGALQLVPFAKAYSGLTDAEFKAVDASIRRHTLERFGPVRSVQPHMVFELGFEGISRSARHKSGVAVRFPRMMRIRSDKALWQSDALPQLLALLKNDSPANPPEREI